MNKYGRKAVSLSQYFYVPELPKHIPDGNSFNPPRCLKCSSISYWDTDNNICQECFNNDEGIQDLKDTHQLSLDDMQAGIDDLGCKLEELSSLKQKYFWKGTSKTDKIDILDELLELIPD